jgi:hypothetical protein
MAIVLNITNYLVLSWASPLTYQVIGHVKTIIILLAGAIQYDSIPQGKTRIGMMLAILGVIVYTEENRQQQLQRAQNLAASNNSGTSNTNGSTRFDVVDIDAAIDKVSQHLQVPIHQAPHAFGAGGGKSAVAAVNHNENHDEQDKRMERKDTFGKDDDDRV